MPQHEMMPDSPGKSIKPQDPCHNRKHLQDFLSQHEMRTYSPATTQEESQTVSGNEKGSLTSLRNHERFTDVPIITREEPRVSYHKWTNITRFYLQCKMMADSPALPPEQFRLPQPAGKED